MNKVVIVILILLVLAGGAAGALYAFGIIGGGENQNASCADGHTWEGIEGTLKEATCTSTGSESYRCKICGEEKTEVLPMKPHDFDTIYATEPTCTRTGTTAGRICDNRGCGYKEGGEVIDKLGHTEVHTPGKAPTCTENGYSDDGTHCETCRLPLKYPSETYPQTGHTYEVADIEPTCAAPGYKNAEVCKDCGDVRVTDDTELIEQLKEHSAELVVKNHATCTSDGYLECPVCHETVMFEEKNQSLHNFSELITAAVAPNCQTRTDGATAVMKCSGCDLQAGGVAIAWETLHEDGHENCAVSEWTIELEATADSAGRKSGPCSVCGETISVDIPISSGDFEDDNNIYDDDKVPTQPRKKKKTA